MTRMPLVIAEVGLNHLGNENYALSYLDKLLKTKIDGISFQVREENFYKRRKKLILEDAFYKILYKKVKKKNKLFGIAIANEKKIDFFNGIKVDFFKIINRDLINKKLVKKIYKSKVKNIFVSTGQSQIKDLKKHLSFLSEKDKKKLIFIHTKFGSSFKKINLESILFIKEKLQVRVGFGNHSPDRNLFIMSLSYKPHSLFFYVKGLKKTLHPDHSHAIKVDETRNFVNYLKKIQLAIGEYKK